MSCTIVVRRACAADGTARAALVRASVMHHTRDAFFMFLFQELTLQLCVLGGAVLFIFCGASVAACCTLVPAAAAIVVAVCVYVTHAVLADKHVVHYVMDQLLPSDIVEKGRPAHVSYMLRGPLVWTGLLGLLMTVNIYTISNYFAFLQMEDMRKEEFGVVAELRGPLLADPRSAAPRIVCADSAPTASPARVVGTASVSELRGAAAGGWLHALAVHERWRRRGVARALVGAARARAGRGALLAAVSALQAPATRLLHGDGWEVRGSYHRPLLGSALTLPVLVLGAESASLA